MATAARTVMNTEPPRIMTTEAHVLTLAQWLSPAFPIGAFAYSHGLEGAVASGWVRGSADFEAWLVDVLDHGAGRSDALFLAAAFHARDAADLSGINATAHAFAASAERLLETRAQGAAFCKTVNAVWATELEYLLYPVAVGAAAAHQDLPLALTGRMYLQAFASNLIASAQRLLPLGQTEGQIILDRLSALFTTIARDTTDGDLDHLGATAYLADIAAMQHETQYSRIFRT